MLTLFFFLLGACIGSFLNVVVYRYNTGFSLNGRSQCFSCGRQLVWYDLIPVFSFLAFKGRCRTCKSKISWQYPVVEVSTSLLFGAIFIYQGLSVLLFIDLIIWSILVAILVYDLRHKIIPDGLVAGFVVAGFVRIFYVVPSSELIAFPRILDLLAGPMLFVPFFLLWYMSRGAWIGLGDGKLAIGMGALMGLKLGISSVVFGFWIGAIFSIFLLLIQKLTSSRAFKATKLGLYFGRNNLTMKSEIPFAPFLILGLLIVYFTHIDALMIGTLLN